MEYLILLLIIIGLYFILPCNLSDLFNMKKCDEEEMDGGIYSGKVTKRKTRKRTVKKTTKKKK